ncbi:alpha-taxilin-like protein [Arabidopsis thaliana]|uniref:Alpha-taxilin-like protein n=1 Tax=Arabidopsis thaliana TaxID=3702 RepID=F4KAG0_ARATH|nr:alpha-taxilin-like protein [Arabidopsis thaliana]AED96000.1 alpha-taxilin-like protein [Arabidopsis thaliana]|eukprot:NP_974921.1 alpha-taxilin-like protein [Arabidopsis thaliana]
MESPHSNLLPEVDSLPDGFVDGATEPPLNSPKTQEETTNHETVAIEKTEKPRTFPVPLCETDGNEDDEVADLIQESIKLELEFEQKEKEASPPISQTLSEGSTQNSTLSKEMDSLKPKKQQEVVESKRKGSKNMFKSEKEFLEFMLKYQQVLSERDSAITVRDKLESLCRELQRQNKMLMEECKRVSTEGQTLRSDLSTKFQDAIMDVSIKLDEQKNESLTQLKENEMLRTKLKHLADQFMLSEQQHEQRLKQKTLELQISALKIKQHEEKLIHEQSQMKVYADQVSQLLSTEKNLRLQLTSDGDKFQQFQDALVKSNEVFETFKQEIDKMSKAIKELRKENAFLKNKTEKSDITLIELVEERERLKKLLEKTKKQKDKLESLCRSLQAERKQKETNSTDSAVQP